MSNKESEFEELKTQIAACNKCNLNRLRGYGFGNLNSKIMFLAQNPGRQPKDSAIQKNEDIIPFALHTEKGEASGLYFRNLLNEFGLTNNDFFVSNIIKCPREDSNSPPTPFEIENCKQFLVKEFELQEPDLIIALGNPSRDFLGLAKNGVLEDRNGTAVISIYHPGYISRGPSKETIQTWYEQLNPARDIIKRILESKIKFDNIDDDEIVIEKNEEQKIYQPFVHLHLHDEYSLLDGFSKVEDYATRAEEFGWKYLSVTNHGMMGQIPRQFKACQRLGLTPIYGCEIYVNDFHEYREYMLKKADEMPLPEGFSSLEELRSSFKKNYHVVLLAKNEIGFKNLLKITSDAWINGYYRRPRATHEFLQSHSEGLLCGSACLAGPISSCILQDKIDRAYKAAEFYKSMFSEDFFIEIMLLDLKEQKLVNKHLIKIAQDLNIDLVLTNDCHYLNKDDSYFQDILLLMQNNNTITDLENKKDEVFQFSAKGLWFKTAEELDETWKNEHQYIPEKIYQQAKLNALKFAEKCKVEIDTTLKIPEFKNYPDNVPKLMRNPDDCLRFMGFEGLKRRKLDDKQEYKDRIEMELDVIKQKKFANYFLIVKDMVDFAINNGIEIGPGRGSAPGSLLCFCLGITDVDPIVHVLFFERFLNIARKDIPDIDIDFAPDGRDKIKQHIIDTYGQKHVCSIGTYGSFQTRATVLDVCRVFDVPLDISRSISKQLGSELDEMSWEETRNNIIYKELFDILAEPQFKRKIRDVEIAPLEAISRIRFKQKNMSSHAAGVIISNVDLTENLPLMTREGVILSSWIEGKKGTELSAFGFVKWDILGLANLIYIKDALALIKERYGKDINVHDIDMNLNDPNVYKDLKEGNGSLVFQFESSLMRKLLKDSRCDNFNVLAAISALGRPGPLQSGMTQDFCKRKLEADQFGNDKSKRSYKINPVLENILGSTYGVVVYQEQIMQIANILAGYSLAETDNFRKVLIKVKKDTKGSMVDKLQEYKKKFIEGGQKYMSIPELEEMFEGFMKWAGYGFNRAHAISYTIISFRCAWLKTYYPAEYVCSVLKNVAKGEAVVKGRKINKYEAYVCEAKRFNIDTKPVDVNLSDINFTIESDKAIRIGLTNLRGIGDSAAQVIVDNRPKEGYTSFKQFLDLVKPGKRIMLPLIRIGTFDKLCGRIEAFIRFYANRKDDLKLEYKHFIEEETPILHKIAEIFKKITNNFTIQAKNLDIDSIDFSKYELTEEEKDQLFVDEFGFGLEHLFNKAVNKYKINIENYLTIAEVKEEKGIAIGCITSVFGPKEGKSKNGYEYLMYYITIEDGYGQDHSISVVMFGDSFNIYKDILKRGKLIIFKLQKEVGKTGFNTRYAFEMILDPLLIVGLNSQFEKLKLMKRTKNLLLVGVDNLNTLENNQEVEIYGIISTIVVLEKKILVNFYDDYCSAEAFQWRNEADIDAKVKKGDIVLFTIKRNDYTVKDKTKTRYHITGYKKIEVSR
jgi:DNA polymerase-3 subunit alpha